MGRNCAGFYPAACGCALLRPPWFSARRELADPSARTWQPGRQSTLAPCAGTDSAAPAPAGPRYRPFAVPLGEEQRRTTLLPRRPSPRGEHVARVGYAYLNTALVTRSGARRRFV